jgi:post-segregation antitoxin (ccd killing protein)
MTILELTLALPDELARDAEAAGLLTPQAIERLISEEMRRRQIDRLFEAADRLAAVDLPQLSEVELEAEIQASRTARRTTRARRN